MELNDENNNIEYISEIKRTFIDKDEENHFIEICKTFANYNENTFLDVKRMERDFESISNLKSFNYMSRINSIKSYSCINYIFLLKVIQQFSYMFKFSLDDRNMIKINCLNVSESNVQKLRHTLRLFVRDWSIEGEEERKNCHFRIINELKNYYDPMDNFLKHYRENNLTNYRRYKILVPGAGLGRLVFELCNEGFEAIGNEFSHFMLLCSEYILNNSTKKEEIEIYPYIHNFNNLKCEKDAFRKILIPDICLEECLNNSFKNSLRKYFINNKNILENDTAFSELVNLSNDKNFNEIFNSNFTNKENYFYYGDMSMMSGEFIGIYNELKYFNQFEAILSSYFIDTAHNIVEYFEVFYKILKKGGILINFGPLVYHYSERVDLVSIELSWEDIKLEAKLIGFKLLKEEFINSVYCEDKNSLIKSSYTCIFATFIKE